MKKNIFFALFSAMLLMTACQQHEIDSPADLGDGFTLVGHSDAQTKTAFGTPDASTIPFLWSEGDKIWSNGAQSELASVSNDGATALFSFTTGSMAGQVYYNMTGASATSAYVKSEQTIGNLGDNGDFGYATVNEGSFTLNHATAYLWFNVTSDVENATLESINIDAYEANIAGKATWDGDSFEDLTEASNSVTLTVGEKLSSTNENVWAMVIFPSALTGAKVTYKLTVDGKTKYFEQELTAAKTLNGGQTARISANITSEGLYELRVLTFEDEDTGFAPYDCEFYYAMTSEYDYKEISVWSDYIPRDGQYGKGHGSYEWYDENNTELAFVKPTIPSWWGISGHAGISDYVGGDDDINDFDADDNMLFTIDLQAYGVNGGANGSQNFCSQYGYKDPEEYATQYSPEGVLPGIQFYDEQPRVIDHMYVTNTTYAYGIITRGECDFGGSYEYTDESTFKIVAYGYDSFEDTEPTSTEFYLLNTGKRMITDWTKWDLSVLGEVVRVEFNLVACYEGYGTYGLVIPAYFAYDDVAVRFPISK